MKSELSKVDILLELASNAPCNSGKQKLGYIMDALHRAEKLEYNKGTQRANFQLGQYYKNCAQNYDEAIVWYEKSLKHAKENKDAQSRFGAQNAIADCYDKKGEYSKALACYKEILAMPLGNDSMIQILGNAGNVYKNMGDYANALDKYQQAYNLLHKDMSSSAKPTDMDTLNLMGLKYQIAHVYLSIPDYKRATASYKEIQELNKKIQFEWFNILADMGMADCYMKQGMFPAAILSYKQAENSLNNLEGAGGEKQEKIAQVYDRLGETYFLMGRNDSAKFYTTKSLQIAEGINGNTAVLAQLPRTYVTMGKIFISNKQYAAAIDYLQKAIAISKQNGAMEVESEALLELSSVLEKCNRQQDALAAFRSHVALRDSIYSRTKMQELTRIDMQGYYDRQQLTDSLKRAEEKAATVYELQRQRILTYSGFGGFALILLLSFFIFRGYKQEKKTNKVISEASKAVSREKQVSEQLLLNILPDEVAEELKLNGHVAAKMFDPATVMFTDFVDFTIAGERMSPQELVAELHTCFKAFDEIIGKYNIEKIKTIGDAYMAAAGLPIADADHAVNMIHAAKAICNYMNERKKAIGDRTFAIRLGISTGSVVAGIVGAKKFAYDIWGDTVNTAARMEQTSEPGRINISEYTYEMVKEHFDCEYRGEIPAKNKGKMKMYFIK